MTVVIVRAMIMGQLCVLLADFLESHPKNVQNENETANRRLLAMLNGASALHEMCFIFPL